jgi:CRP-like cAMP-binding protein
MKETQSNPSTEPLLEHPAKSFTLNEEEKELVRTNFHSRLFRKRQYILHEGDVCTHFNFVVRGCLRSYKIDERGNPL